MLARTWTDHTSGTAVAKVPVMSRPRWKLALLAAVLTLAFACAPPREDQEAGSLESSTVQLELALRGSELTILAIRASDEPLRALPTRGAVLRWDVVDLQGEAKASGFVEDPRQLRAESSDGDHDHEASSGVGALSLTVPAGAGVLTLSEIHEGASTKLAEVRLPRAGELGTSTSALIDPSKDLVGQPVLISGSESSAGLTLLIVGDGYTKSELAKFRTDAAQLSQRLLAQDGYSRHAARVRIYRQDVRSTQSALADPALGNDPVTAFELSFGDGASRPRRCVMFEPSVGVAAMEAIRSRREAVSADAVVILANSSEYGGCAAPASALVTVTRHAESARILAHELGHTVFKLADEYDGNQCGVYAPGPNVASSTKNLPWKALVNASKLPTPLSAAPGTIGAFKGANHCTSGAYRPTATCLMRDLGQPFCPVCSAEVDRFFEPGAGGAESGPLTVTNQTGGGVFVRCAGTPSGKCSGWTYLADGATKTIKSSAPGRGLYLDTQTIEDPAVELDHKHVLPSASAVTLFPNADHPLGQQ